MTHRSTALMALTAAAFTFACGSNPEPVTPPPADVQAPAAQAPAAQAPAAETPAQTPAAETPAQTPAATATLTDERVMELARGYVEMLQDRDWAGVWEHVAPAGKERFGSLETFATEGERVMDELGPEVATVSETVEEPRAGMLANKVYIRVSHYEAAGDAPVRMMIGLLNDGSIVGVGVNRGQ